MSPVKFKTDNLISQNLFLTIPLLHSHLIKPFESLFKSEISPMQFYTLIALHQNGEMSMTELSSFFGIPKQQMTKIINHLSDIGAVTRESDPSDRRLVKIRVRDDADAYVAKYRESICHALDRALDSLDEADRNALLEAMNTIQMILPKIEIQNK